MSLPWMPLYIRDYLADTAHLRAAQSGAYLHLIMHYWQRGSLPDDDDQLAAIAKMPDKEWRQNRPLIEAFFQPGWKHPRIDAEKADAHAKYEQRVGAGRTGGKASAKARAARRAVIEATVQATVQATVERSLERPSNGRPSETQAKSNQPQPQAQRVGGGVTREAEEAYLLALGQSSRPDKPPEKKRLISEEAFALAPEILRMIGVEDGHPLSMGAPYSVQTWLNGGWPVEAIKAGIQRAMANKQGDPPSTLKYFEKAIARCHAEMTRELPVVKLVPQTITETHHGKAQRPGGSLIASIDRALAQSIEEDRRAAMHEDPVLSLPARPVH